MAETDIVMCYEDDKGVVAGLKAGLGKSGPGHDLRIFDNPVDLSVKVGTMPVDELSKCFLIVVDTPDDTKPETFKQIREHFNLDSGGDVDIRRFLWTLKIIQDIQDQFEIRLGTPRMPVWLIHSGLSSLILDRRLTKNTGVLIKPCLAEDLRELSLLALVNRNIDDLTPKLNELRGFVSRRR